MAQASDAHVYAVQQAYAAQLRQFYSDAAEADEGGASLRWGQGWPLADHVLPSLRQPENRSGLPAPVLEAHDFYQQCIAARDLGSVHGVTLLVGGEMTWAIAVTTDGDDGWLEIYDIEGNLLAAGRSYLDRVLWAAREVVRAWTQTAALPPALLALGPERAEVEPL